jgi:hypothetical protein
MAKGDIWMGLTVDSLQLLSPAGREFSEGVIEGTRTDRTQSGRLVKEVLWSKRTFSLDYSIIDGNDLAVFKTFYTASLTQNLILRIDYDGVTTPENIPVSLKPFKRKRDLLTGTQLWSGISIDLEEV